MPLFAESRVAIDPVRAAGVAGIGALAVKKSQNLFGVPIQLVCAAPP